MTKAKYKDGIEPTHDNRVRVLDRDGKVLAVFEPEFEQRLDGSALYIVDSKGATVRRFEDGEWHAAQRSLIHGPTV